MLPAIAAGGALAFWLPVRRELYPRVRAAGSAASSPMRPPAVVAAIGLGVVSGMAPRWRSQRTASARPPIASRWCISLEKAAAR